MKFLIFSTFYQPMTKFSSLFDFYSYLWKIKANILTMVLKFWNNQIQFSLSPKNLNNYFKKPLCSLFDYLLVKVRLLVTLNLIITYLIAEF